MTAAALEGRCECGAVRFRLNDRPIMTNCCHCRDCQRITGSAFAINAMIETGGVEVTAGEPVVRSLGREGQRETRAWRCGTCDALLWADHPMFGDRVRFVRAGTLDRADALPPDAHYFTRSRHPWVTIPDGVPAYETLPEDGAGVRLDPDRARRMAAAIGNPTGG